MMRQLEINFPELSQYLMQGETPQGGSGNSKARSGEFKAVMTKLEKLGKMNNDAEILAAIKPSATDTPHA